MKIQDKEAANELLITHASQPKKFLAIYSYREENTL
jgi:hypothetical protein